MSTTATLSKPWNISAGYLDGATYDNTLIWGVMLLALASGGVVIWKPELFPIVLIADLWLLGYHHVIATYTKLGTTKEDRKENRFLIYGLPFLVLGSVAFLYYLSGAIIIVTIYFFWQWYHYVRQSYGISAFYRRKSNIQTCTPITLDNVALWSIPAWGILHRCTQGWDTFIYQPLWTPNLPTWVSTVAGVVACTIFLVWLVSKAKDYANGQLLYAPFFFLLSHHLIFFVGYVAIGDITIGWLVANVWHNTQYILFIWLFNQNRFRPDSMKEESPIMNWVCQKSPWRVVAYFAFFVVWAAIIYRGIQLGIFSVFSNDSVKVAMLIIIIYQAFNFHHYIVDSIIWKARKKSNREVLNIEG